MPPKARVQKRLYYKIGEACKLLDIQPYVLRYWETEFPALAPSKSRSGQRVYSEKELGVIRRIKELLYEEGYTIAGAKKKLDVELAAGAIEELQPALPELGDEPRAVEEPAAEERPAEVEAAPAVPAAAPPPVARAAPPEPPPTPLPAAGAELDTRTAERIQRLRSGIERALTEAREILALLDS